MEKLEQKFLGHLCATCGGPAPEWKCPECGQSAYYFDPRHFTACKFRGKMQAKCERCGEAESKCACL